MTRRRRLLIIGINYAPEVTGVAPYTTGMAEALAAHYDVQVLTTPPHYPAWNITDGWDAWRKDTVESAVSVRRLRHYVPHNPTGITRILSEASFAVRSVATRVRKPDVIVAASPALLSVYAAAVLAKIHKAPLGVVVQDIYTHAMTEVGLLGGRAAAMTRTVEARALCTADGVAVIHDRFRDQMVSTLGVDPERISVIRNWSHIHSPTGNRSTMRAQMGWGDHEVIALHAGNMGAKQGLENVVDAAHLAGQSNSRVRFVLMGDGNRRKTLQDWSTGVDRLEVIDPVQSNDFPDVLAAADVLLLNELPGVAEMCIPSKLTSYFASGRPVVAATNEQSAAALEVRTAGAGTVIEPGEPAQLLSAVDEVASGDTDAIGARGRHFAQQHLSASSAADAYVHWVDRLVSASRRTRLTL